MKIHLAKHKMVVIPAFVAIAVFLLTLALFAPNVLPFSKGTNGITLSVVITDTNGKQWLYTCSTCSLKPLTITAGGVAIATIEVFASAAITYSGTISSGGYTGQLSGTSTSPSVVMPAALSFTYQFPSAFPIPASGASAQISAYDASSTVLSAGAYGTYTMTVNAQVNAQVTFTDGTTGSLSKTGSVSISYSYASSNVLSLLSVTFSTGFCQPSGLGC